MLYTRHDIATRMNAIAQCIAVQLDGPPHLSASRKADRQVADSFCMLPFKMLWFVHFYSTLNNYCHYCKLLMY